MIKTRQRFISRVTWGWKLKLPEISIRDSQTRWWIGTIIYVCILAMIVFGPFLRVKTIVCETNTQIPCPDFIAPELKKFNSHLIYLLQTEAITQRLSANVPEAQKISITPVWPDTLKAEIVMQPGFANLGIPASTSAFLVGKSGQLITVQPFPDPQFPTIIASSAADLIISDQLTNPSLTASLDIIKKCQEMGRKVSTIYIASSQEISVNLDDGQQILFTSQKSIQEQVLRLQLIFSQTTINLTNKVIDLRYDRPALK